MPSMAPPPHPTQPPATVRLRPGWSGFRISREPFRAGQFNYTRATNPFEGGRFDSVNGGYGYLYIGSTLDVAVAETLIRDVEFPADGSPRALPRKRLANKYYARVTIDTSVELVDLTDHPQLARLGQDEWLTQSKPYFYPQTRAWADAIRAWAPRASGFIWRPRHQIGQRSVVLFDDTSASPRPSPNGHLVCGLQWTLSSGRGLAVVKRSLGRFSVVLDA